MIDTELITVSTKGQIAIPVKIRKKLNIENGSKLIAYVYGDTIMLKILKVPSAQEFKETMDKAQEWAKSVGFEESEVDRIIKEARKK